MEEVLPTIRKTGTYSMPKQEKQLTFYEYFDKTYKGEPVLSSMDVSNFTSINCATCYYYARKHLKNGTDYYCLKGSELQRYKLENPKVSRLSSAVVLFTWHGFNKICKAYGIETETPKLFIEDNKVVTENKNSRYEQVDTDDYIMALKVLRTVRKNVLNILKKDKIEAFDTCIHYMFMDATTSTF